MRAWWLSAVVAAAACADDPVPEGEPLAPTLELAIVAHQGDDLWFMQPDVIDSVERGGGVTVVYVTAGDGEAGTATTTRHDGPEAAYAAITGAAMTEWLCGRIELAGHAAEHCRLDAQNISLVFLGYPPGGADGAAADSLLHLWEAKVSSVPEIGQGATTYDQRGLIATLTEIINATGPVVLRTLEIAATHGDDHSDHMLTGALAVLALAASGVSPDVIAYRGDNIAAEPVNVAPALSDRSLDVVARYAACAAGCARCGTPCATDRLTAALPGAQLAWLARSYSVGTRTTASGRLQLAGGCVAASRAGDNASIVDCATAPTWSLDEHDALIGGVDLCLDAILTGELVAGPCTGAGAGGRYFLDDEGHLWSGVVPAPQADMALAHLDCMIAAGGRPRAALCGAARAPTVQFTSP